MQADTLVLLERVERHVSVLSSQEGRESSSYTQLCHEQVDISP